MNNWKQFLASQGARTDQAQPDLVRDFGTVHDAASLGAGFVSIIGDLGLIAASGDDAANFLHKQLTNDIEHLPEGHARLAGYCSAKGRLQASFLVWRRGDAIVLQLARELLPALQKRLQMFILRAKVKLSDLTAAPGHQVLLGLGGAKAQAVLPHLFGVLPAAPYQWTDHPLGMLMRLPDAFGAPRYQWITSPDTATSVWPQLRESLAAAGNDAWRLADIHAGLPLITAKTQEQFVPQMVNFELLGGVNFKKGCYPGQEIVARSQYLGKLKRRTTLARVASPVAAGDDVFAADDPDQPCGMVVNAAPNGAGMSDVLVEMKLAALEKGAVHLGSASGPALAFLPMPYALDALDL